MTNTIGGFYLYSKTLDCLCQALWSSDAVKIVIPSLIFESSMAVGCVGGAPYGYSHYRWASISTLKHLTCVKNLGLVALSKFSILG